MATKFYKCPHCGNVIIKLVDSGVTPVCCGQEMQELNPRLEDGAKEKHVPVVYKNENGKLSVKVGEVAHPMLEEHHICFIALEYENGIDVINLEVGKAADVEICCHKGKIKAVYEYCNLHGLWMTTKID